MIRVAAAQVALDIDDPGGTWARVEAAVERAAAEGADLVVLPELVSTGATFVDAAESSARAEPLTGRTVTALRALSARHEVVLAASVAETSGLDRPYNTAVLVDGGEVVAAYRKTHLWDSEKVLFTPGSEPPPVVSTRVGRIGLVVCYDLEFPEVTRRLARQGAQVIAAPANWPLLPKPTGERPIETAKAMAAAAQNRVIIAIADRCGTDRGQDWTGGSCIVDLSGYLAAEAAIGEPDLIHADVDPDLTDDKRLGPYNDAFGDLRPELYETPPDTPRDADLSEPQRARAR